MDLPDHFEIPNRVVDENEEYLKAEKLYNFMLNDQKLRNETQEFKITTDETLVDKSPEGK